ncbi:flippase [candidate division KSB1 bacterium]|nr:flippase [candidate division KSB1 bacterium]
MENETKSKYNIVKNLFFSTISTFTTFFLFILITFVGRYLGKSEYGIFNTALSIATIFEIFTDIGLCALSVRNVSREKELTGKYIGNLLSLKIILSVIIYGAMLITVNIMDYDGRTKLIIYLMTVSSILKNMKYTFRLFFQAHNFFGWDTLLVLIERSSLLGICLAVLFKWQALLPFVISFVSVRLVDFLLTMILLRYKIAPVKIQFDFPFIKKLQIEALPLGLFYIILTIFAHIDTVMLSLMRSFSDVGLYNAAYKIYEGITILPSIFWLVFLPRLSELYTTNPDHHMRLAVKAVKYMFVAGLPTLSYGILFANLLISFFFKGEYTPAIVTLQILLVGIAFEYPNWMLNATLISMNRQIVIMFLGMGGLAVKILLNLMLIPRYGYNGAAAGTVIAEFMIFLGAVIYLYRHHINLPVLRLAIKPMLATVLIFVTFKYLTVVPVLPLMILMGLIYLGAILVLRTFDRDEVGIIFDGIQSMVKR